MQLAGKLSRARVREESDGSITVFSASHGQTGGTREAPGDFLLDWGSQWFNRPDLFEAWAATNVVCEEAASLLVAQSVQFKLQSKSRCNTPKARTYYN